MIGLIVTAAAIVGGFIVSRDFVRRRLRYVDAVKKPAAPFTAPAMNGAAGFFTAST